MCWLGGHFDEEYTPQSSGAGPWLLGGGTLASRLNDLIAGALIIVLSIPSGEIRNTYGSWNPLIV